MSSRESRLAENAWHLNEALHHVAQLHSERDQPVGDQEKADLQIQLARLRNKCLTAPPPKEDA